MEDVIEDFRRTVEESAARMLSMTEEESRVPRAVGKWSAKETLGHLIDSASNNHQRFVRAQFTDELVFPGYEQERWVRAQAYNEEPRSEEHTSELQSLAYLVCRLLLEKKKKIQCTRRQCRRAYPHED